MECDIRIQRIGESRFAPFPLFEPMPDRADIVRVSEPRRERGRLWFDRHAQLVEMAQQVDREIALQRPA